MKILTINAGSSSVKYSVFDTSANIQLVHSEIERVASVEDAMRRIPALLQAEGVTGLDVIGPRGEIKNVRVLGPCRDANQIEIAETEAYKLGIDMPVRLSGDTRDTPVVTLRGTVGSIQTEGLIVAKRHIHMNSKDAEARGLKHGDQVEVAIQSDGRDLIFRDVAIRVDPHVITEMHIDTDEANAAHIKHGGVGELIYIPIASCTAQVTRRQAPTGMDKSCCLNKPEKKEAA